MKNGKKGRIDISALNVPPEKHEFETAKYFADRGFDVVFIGPHYIIGAKNPDFEIAGKIIKVVESNLSDEHYADYLRWLKEEQGYC